MTIKLKINGNKTKLKSEENTPLLWALRDELKLTGTKYGCGIAQCGACTVHVNGRAVRSCITPINTLKNAEVTTIEGADSTVAENIKKAWLELDVPQCGFCQSGQIMSAIDLLKHNASPSEEEIDQAMAGNLCQCATYARIKQAITNAATVNSQEG